MSETNTSAILDRLAVSIAAKRDADPATSYTARLMQRGVTKIAQKVGEEAVETVIEAVAGNRAALISESADLLYHLVVLWQVSGVDPSEIWAELAQREGQASTKDVSGKAG